MHKRCLCYAHCYHDTGIRVARNLPPGAAFVDLPSAEYYRKTYYGKTQFWPNAAKLHLQKRFGVVIPKLKWTVEPKPKRKLKWKQRLKPKPQPKPGATIKLKAMAMPMGENEEKEITLHQQNDSDASQLAVNAYGEPQPTAANDGDPAHLTPPTPVPSSSAELCDVSAGPPLPGEPSPPQGQAPPGLAPASRLEQCVPCTNDDAHPLPMHSAIA